MYSHILRNLSIFSKILFVIALSVSLYLGRALAYLDETRPETVLISPYKPTYFLIGTPDTKIQLSFKGQLVEAIPIYLGYTQLMFWDLFETSAPFQDLNYNPEIFYRVKGFENPLTWLDIGIFEHESNGKSGGDSRSWNRLYLLYNTGWSLRGNLKMTASARAWAPYALSDNSDITHYRGLAEFTVTLSGFLGSSFDRDDLLLRFYFGGDSYLNPLKGGQELTFRAKSKARKFLPLFTAQLFHGYGESLLDYQENRTGLRVGIGF
jgi:phospholipase A1